MKTEKFDASADGADHLAVEADNDLELPTLDAVAPSSLGSLTQTVQDAPPASTGQAVGGLQPRPLRVALKGQGPGRGLYIAAGLATLLWAALVLYGAGYQGPIGTLEFQPFQVAALAVLAIAPIGFFWIAAYAMSQGSRLAAEVVRHKAIAQDMLEPAALALGETGHAVEAVRLEIQAAAMAAANARAELLSLRQALAEETAKLTEATTRSAKAANALSQTLGREREDMTALTTVMDGRAAAVAEAVMRQAKMVAEASDLAQAQIGEAEAALAARATDLATAAGDAGQAARLASEDLARQIARLETGTIGVSDQIRAMEDTLTGQRAALISVAHTLRADHEDLSLKIETQCAQLSSVVANAQLSVSDLNAAALSAGETIREFSEAAAAQAQEIAEATKAERDLLAASALQTLGAVSEAARFEREAIEADVDQSLQALAGVGAREAGALEDGVKSQMVSLANAARTQSDSLREDALKSLETMTEAAETASRLAETHHEAARRKMEELGETAFAASQRAEAAFQARLHDADALIAKSAELVDQAAATTGERIERATDHAKSVLHELETAVSEFETRVAKLPAQTQAQAEELRATISAGFSGLLASARAAAEETQAIDAAFQDRVKRNYEMLSEAVRLMGVVSGRPGGAPRSPSHMPSLTPLTGDDALEVRTQHEPGPAATPPPEPSEPAKPRFSFASRASALGAGLRPRLKLSPTNADTQVSSLFEAPAEAPAAAGGSWTWQELLSSMDDAPAEDGRLAGELMGEIEGLGVDTSALLPQARIDEIAAVMEAGDIPGARTVVRHIAPAGVRRLSRRALAEPTLREHAERYVQRYWTVLDQTLADQNRDGAMVTGLLSTAEGRAFLLFDAALGETR